MKIDPILLETMLHKFRAVTEEMGIALARTARSSYVRETQDFATALVGLDGRFFAYPTESGVSLALDHDCRMMIDAVPDLGPGDVIISNHPYAAAGLGSHLPDVNVIMPYYVGDTLVCYGWTFAHWVDVGGAVPSSISPSFETLYQEGLQIPPLKLIEGGKRNAGVFAMLGANSRAGEVILGDLQAQISALIVGDRRIAELAGQYGTDLVQNAQAELVDYAKTRALAVQKTLPDGDYDFWDYLDDDYRTRIPVRFRCRLTVSKGHFHLDLTGTDPQLAAPYNVPTGGMRNSYLTAKILHLLLTRDPHLPINYGLFENITVSVPQGTVMSPVMPAPVGVRHAGAIRFNDAVLGCLGRADRLLTPAASGGTVIPAVVAQTDADTGRHRVSVIQAIGGGGGATSRGDGPDGRDRSLANIFNTPTESGERDVDVRIEEYAMRTDSAGPGRHRGGAGVTYSIRFLQDGMDLMGRGLERFVFQPWGVAGGRPGETARVVLNLGQPDERELGKIDRVRLSAGDVVTLMTPGGGGLGDPFERAPEAVANDVRNRVVSIAGAARDYGVVIDPGNGQVDEPATYRLRAVPRELPNDSGFGAARMLWEQVFGDDAMTRFAQALLTIPEPVRQKQRLALYEDIVPGVARVGVEALMTEHFDFAAARDRLEQAIRSIEGAEAPVLDPVS